MSPDSAIRREEKEGGASFSIIPFSASFPPALSRSRRRAARSGADECRRILPLATFSPPPPPLLLLLSLVATIDTRDSREIETDGGRVSALGAPPSWHRPENGSRRRADANSATSSSSSRRRRARARARARDAMTRAVAGRARGRDERGHAPRLTEEVDHVVVERRIIPSRARERQGRRELTRAARSRSSRRQLPPRASGLPSEPGVSCKWCIS